MAAIGDRDRRRSAEVEIGAIMEMSDSTIRHRRTSLLPAGALAKAQMAGRLGESTAGQPAPI
jgi:hypothetical protein